MKRRNIEWKERTKLEKVSSYSNGSNIDIINIDILIRSYRNV